MFLLISCFTVILLPFCVTKLIEFYILPQPSLGRYLAECDPAVEGYTLPPLSSTETSLCHGKWTGNKRKRMRDDKKGKEKKRGFKPPILIMAFFYWNSQQEPLWGREGYPSYPSQHRHLVPGVFHKEYQYNPSYNELSRKVEKNFFDQCLKCEQRLNF